LLEAPTDASAAKALEVSGIPELADMILMELPPKDLLTAAQVNRTFNASVMSSNRIARKLYLTGPEPHSWFRTNFGTDYADSFLDGYLMLLGMSVNCEHMLLEDGPEPEETMDVHMHFDGRTRSRFLSSHSLRQPDLIYRPTIGSRRRAMLLCQPPIMTMTAAPDCCKIKVWVELHSPTGLTVGDLLDATAEMQHAHRHCPNAPYHEHERSTGLVVAGVSFSGNVTLRPDDPGIPRRRDTRADFGSPDYRSESSSPDQAPPPRTPLASYVQAKQAALAAGESIPSFEEFLGPDLYEARIKDHAFEQTAIDPESTVADTVYAAASAELVEMGLSDEQADDVAGTLLSCFVNRGARLTEVMRGVFKLLPDNVGVDVHAWRSFAEWLMGRVIALQRDEAAAREEERVAEEVGLDYGEPV
jgi:hypothetical protein